MKQENDLEKRVSDLEVQFATFSERMSNIHSNLEALMQKVEVLLDRLDRRYASKIFETVVSGLVAAILLAFIGALCMMVFPRTAQAAMVGMLNITNLTL